MDKIYHPYYRWECFINGMYHESSPGSIDQAVYVLSDCEIFDKALYMVISKWKYSSEEHLSNVLINRQAWCGQVACCYMFSVPEIRTRKAWAMLTNMQRHKANKIADKHIRRYERENRTIRKELGRQMLFEWDSR